MNITVNVHLADLPALLRMGAGILHELAEIRQTQQRIIAMSGTLAEQLAANTAEQRVQAGRIRDDIAAIAARLEANQQPVGTTLTQDMVDADAAVTADLKAVADAMDTLATPAAPAPTV